MYIFVEEKTWSSVSTPHDQQSTTICFEGPYFTVGQLADIAHELDRKEKELMLSIGVDTTDVRARLRLV